MSKAEKQIGRIKIIIKACDETCETYDSEDMCTLAQMTAYQHICKVIEEGGAE